MELGIHLKTYINRLRFLEWLHCYIIWEKIKDRLEFVILSPNGPIVFLWGAIKTKSAKLRTLGPGFPCRVLGGISQSGASGQASKIYFKINIQQDAFLVEIVVVVYKCLFMICLFSTACFYSDNIYFHIFAALEGTVKINISFFG